VPDGGENDGAAGFLADRRLCSNPSGGGPRQCFGHIEHTSTKANTTVSGYRNGAGLVGG